MSPHPTCGASKTFKWCWAGLILALTLLPYWVGWWLTPKGYFYSWIVPPYPADSIAYLAWSRQAYNGRILFSLKYTAIPHSPFLFNPFFLACGWLARVSGVQLAIAHLAMKSAGVIFFFVIFFKFLEHFNLNRLQSTVASILVGISSGFGGVLQLFLGQTAVQPMGPPDLVTVDWNTFWCLLWNPLFPYSLALILLAIYLMDKAATENSPKLAWMCGLAVGALTLIHPYPVLPLAPLLILIAVVRRRENALALLSRVACAAGPCVAYVVGVYFFHPLLRQHSALGEMRSPSVLNYFVGFGLPLILAILGLSFRMGKIYRQAWPFVLWAGLDLILSRFPVWFQGKLIFGAHLPICILAAISFDSFRSAIRGQTAKKLFLAGGALLLPLASYSQVVVFRNAVSEMRENADSDYFMSSDKMAGFEYLKEHSHPDDLVFAGIVTSAMIAAYSGNTVLWGHWAQAVDYDQRLAWYHGIFDASSGLTDQERSDQFWAAGIRYLFAEGPMRRGLAGNIPRWLAADVKKVFENGEITVYMRR